MEQRVVVPPSPLNSTDYQCIDSDCQAVLCYGDEVVLLQVAHVVPGDGEVLKFPVLENSNEPDRDFEFEPHYFCIECWSRAHEYLLNELDNRPPIYDPASILFCACCESGIRASVEYAGVVEVGEFQRSRRTPVHTEGSTNSPRFFPSANPVLICLSCLTLIVEGYIDLWPNLSQIGECVDCTAARCWRAPCTCTCHDVDPDAEPNE